MNTNVRLRFAPSPTGELHLGGARTALYNFLFAKKNGGRLILRIEDTDQQRFQQGAMERFFSDLDWLGIKFDEDPNQGGNFGPYVQSQRKDIHSKYAHQLVDQGGAYFCFCTEERLAKLRLDQQKKHQKIGYDRLCRNLGSDEIKNNLNNNQNYVVRLKIPESGNLVIKDLIRGDIEFDLNEIDDAILLKSDGFPTYHLANVVDDHLMNITHVMRAEEWLPSTPKHIIIYKNFNWEPPRFAHLPLLLAKDKKKLSKRIHGEKVWISTYRDQGYLPQALINYLALLGWNPGDEREFFSIDQLIKEFDLSKVNKAGAIFDENKLDHFQGHYIRGMNNAEFLKILKQFKPEEMSSEIFRKAGEIIKTRIIKLADFSKLTEFFVKIKQYDSNLLIFRKSDKDKTLKGLQGALEELLKNNLWEIEKIGNVLATTTERIGLTNGDVFWPVRIALTGEEFSPPPHECAWVLGKEETLARINIAISKLTLQE